MAGKGHDLMFQSSGNFINGCKKVKAEFGNDENQMPGSYSAKRDAPGHARNRKSTAHPKRKKQPWKEQQRNLEIKEALNTLSHSMPFVNKEMSRIRTLRLAKAYINHLKKILEGEMVECKFTGKLRPITLSDFEQVVNEEMQITNSYKERALEEISLDTTRTSSLSQDDEPPPSTTPTTADPKQGRKRSATPNVSQIKHQPPSTSPMQMQFANNFCETLLCHLCDSIEMGENSNQDCGSMCIGVACVKRESFVDGIVRVQRMCLMNDRAPILEHCKDTVLWKAKYGIECVCQTDFCNSANYLTPHYFISNSHLLILCIFLLFQ